MSRNSPPSRSLRGRGIGEQLLGGIGGCNALFCACGPVVHHIRFLLVGDEIASLVFGQTGIHGSQDLGVHAIGVKLLQLRPQVGALGRGGGEGDAANGKALVS